MLRKYLDDIGVAERPDTFRPDDERQPKWKEEREVYGFDSRETWALDQTFYLWLYERLMMYKEIAIVDLTFHKFEYNGNSYTQIELIDAILERLKFSFSDEYKDYEDKQWEYVHEVEKMWAVVLPAMWW